MINYQLLEREMHTLTTSEISELQSIASTVFEPLMRPFRQKRTVPKFDYRKTIRQAQKIGHLMPAYSRQEREHRKSKLVIALSLSGVDRCAAVSLIPLFSELRKFLDFKLFIFTSDLIEAKFTRDGFIENDHEISWNNVAAPIVYHRLADMNFNKNEDTLLLIDSLGGGDSRWYWNWNRDDQSEVAEEQKKYLIPEGNWGGYWSKLRNTLGGDFNKINELPKSSLPAAWEKVVKRNTEERWVESPALQDYLVRWLFHPEFGRRKHGDWFPQKERFHTNHLSVSTAIQRLQGKFKSVNLLIPNNSDASENNLERLKTYNFVDYVHYASSIQELSHVMSNIVHNRCTDKLTHNKVIFKEYIESDSETDSDENGDMEHDELKATKENCFRDCPVVNSIPSQTKFNTVMRKRGEYSLSDKEIPFNQVDVGEWLSENEYNQMLSVTPKINIDPTASKFTHLKECEAFLNNVKSDEIKAIEGYSEPRIKRVRRQEGEKIVFNPTHHRTRVLGKHIDDLAELISPKFKSFFDELPLANVVWCSNGLFQHGVMSIGINPASKPKWGSEVFHEIGHYIEYVTPQVGAFTNLLLRKKIRKLDRQKLVQLMPGEYAMPVMDGSAPWIKPYAGKWYPRTHQDLPNATEILSVHLEYFQSPEKLLILAKHDPFMVRFIAFVLMGGPIAVFEAVKEAKEIELLSQLQQKNRVTYGYTTSRGRGRSSGRSSSNYKPKKKENRFGV